MELQIPIPHLPNEVREEVFREFVKQDDIITPGDHSQILDTKLMPLMQDMGEDWANRILDMYYQENTFQLVAPALNDLRPLQIPPFAHRVRSVELVLPIVGFWNDIHPYFHNFTRDRGCMLQYLFTMQRPLTRDAHTQIGLHPVTNNFAVQQGPPITTEWWDRFPKMANLTIKFWKPASWGDWFDTWFETSMGYRECSVQLVKLREDLRAPRCPNVSFKYEDGEENVGRREEVEAEMLAIFEKSRSKQDVA
ncbi:unnamed protein product [Periconia digitata]|uniref:Uncharacterized protein n=1 Tax=Periconia digitata TaxID=1303443 RepID=A0A9W4UNP5_9PLEO|nr:unnamed protein product [Periconia digitata]